MNTFEEYAEYAENVWRAFIPARSAIEVARLRKPVVACKCGQPQKTVTISRDAYTGLKTPEISAALSALNANAER